MAAIVANGVCRYAVHGLFAGRQVVNILDMKIDTTGVGTDRDEACFRQAGRILNAWNGNVLALLVNNYSAQSVSWVDLDELDGPTGQRTSTDTKTWPTSGLSGNEALPGNVAIRINKITNSRRGSKQGRMYLCGADEFTTSDAAPNTVTETNQGLINAAMDTFLSEITSEEVLYDSQLHVVHTAAGVFTTSSEVDALTVDATLGSQRRRLR